MEKSLFLILFFSLLFVFNAGADIIITGTVVEDSDDVRKKIHEIVEALRR